jgi:predicted phosphoribosyltransferase
VPVAIEVAKALRAPLDLLLVRKIGAQGQPELGLGAVVDGGETVLNDDIVAATGASEAFIAAARDLRTDRHAAARQRQHHAGRFEMLLHQALCQRTCSLGTVGECGLHELLQKQRQTARL